MVDECEACALRVADDCTICQTSSVEVQVAAVNQQRAAADKRIRDAIEALHLSRRQMKSLVYGPSFVAARVGTVPVNRHRYDYIVPVKNTGGCRDTHTGRAHSRTRDEHTVTDRESHDQTDPQTRSHGHTSSQPIRPTQTHGEDQVTHDPVPIRGDSEEAAPSEPNPDPSRSQSTSPRLLDPRRPRSRVGEIKADCR